MISLFFFDFSIGLLLLCSLCFFYQVTKIFYVMLGIHWICSTLLLGILFDFWAFIFGLIMNPLYIIGYLVPLIVQILLAALSVFLRSVLNSDIMTQDIMVICITPALMLLLPFIFPKLQDLMSSDARFSIYTNWNILGITSNTLILILGGFFGLFISMKWFGI